MIKTRKLLTVVITVVMLLQSIGFSGFAAVGTDNFKDFPNGSWSEEAMIAAVENGLLVGTSDTTIEPKKNLTRAEFAAIITRAFGATEKADISNFKDVDAGKWYAEPIAKAVQMGVMNGTGTTTFDPNAFMKREDVILALARVLFVDGDDTSVLEQFSDRDKIDTWSVKAIAGMVNEGYVNGYEDGTIRPLNFITREELAQLFHNIFKTYISEDGEFNSVAKKGSVIVRSKYVTLKDVTIDGDLIMADGIGGGDFRISNVHVTGKIIARGGEGMNYFVNVTSDGKVIVNDPNGTVNFYNYREEDTPFKGGNVIENTPATFLERKSVPTSPSMGGGTTYKLTFKDIDGNDVKTVSKTNKNYVITDGDVPTDAQMAEDGYIFKGWSTDKNATSGESRDYFIDKKIGDVKGTWYPVYVEGYEVVFYADDTVGSPVKTETGVVEASYVIQDSDVPADADMEKSGFEFQGWSQQGSVEVKNRTYFVGKNASEVKGEWYPVYVKLTVYKVSFKYNDGTEALAAVEKTLKPSEDHVLTNTDVKDVAHPTAPADYKFIGWSETANDTTNVVSSAELQVSIKTLDGKTYYAQFEKVTDNYTVVFKYTDGTEISRVEKTLSDSENYVLTNADVKDVDYHTNPADYTFLGWTDTVDGTDYKTSAELQVSIKDLDGKTYYAQYERNETTYSVSFKYNDGTEALATVEKNLVASEDYVLTNADVKDVAHPTAPADYKFLGWAEAGSTTVLTSAELQVSIRDLDGKTFYAQFEKVTDNYTVVFKYTDGTEINKVEKTLSASEDYTLSASDVADVDYHTNPADYTFLGWTETVDGTDYKTSAELRVSIKDLDGKTYYAQYERNETTYSVSFKYEDGSEALPTVEKNLVASEDYVLTNADVKDVAHPTAPADYKFIGWAEAGSTTVLTSAELQVSIKSLDGKTYYAQFERDETTYSVSFKYEDGTEALATVEKNLVDSEDYVLTNADVKDIAHPTAPADYKFIGWAEAGSSVVLTSAELQVSIRDLDGKTYYAQFEEITDVYTIIFKDNDENELVTLTKDEDESIIDSEIPAVTVDASSVFKGWATTKGSTTVEYDNTYLASDVVANIFLSTTVVTLYPVIVDKDAVEYFVEHYFEDLDGNYVLDASKTQSGFEIPGKTVTATALTVEHYEENITHADRLEEGVIPDAPEVLTLKFFYDLEVLKVNYYDLYFDENSPVLEYEVKYGGTIDNFCYPGDDFDAAVNEDIKNEISDYVEYLKMAGYGKDYNDEYFYPLFEDKLGGAYEPMYPHFNYPYEHAISFKWYVEDDVEEFVVFDESHVFTEDLDLYSKVKKLNVEFILPEKLSGGMPLIINVPYEESTRFLDSVRDALFINDNIATYPDTTGLEEKFYEKMSNVGGKVFGDDGVFNSNNEINNTDIFVYFYQLMGGKAKYREWLWEEVETEVENSLGPRGKDLPRSQYESLRSMGLNQEQALYTFFIENKFGLDFTGELAFAFGRYIDSKKFIDMSSNEDQFLVTVNNEFIMEKVEEKVESLASVDSVITEYGGGRVPEGLLNRLPMDIIEDVYEPRVQRFLNQLDDARAAAANGEPEENCMVDSGIYFDVNLIDEILVPGMEFAKESHEKAVNKAVNSNNKGAKLVEKYYVDNPYVTGEAGNYGVVNYAFEPSFYVTKTGNVDANGYSMYKINSFESIYKEMVMPESVETIDSLLWLLDPNGGAVDFANIRKLAEDNEDLILALHNHPHALMADYAVNGLPENMEEYWEDLLSDPEIKKAVEKLDNNVSFDMMFFVESKIQNATLEMYYLKVLDKAGVPVENILSKYTNSKAYKELTSADFHKLLDQLEECWETVEIDGKPVVNANGTTDYVFDNVLEKVGSSGDVATASVKGFEVIITRFFADDLFQNAPNN